MKPVERSEVLGLGDYETVRERFRARVIQEKRARRIALGDRATAVFENRDTVLLQVQEMLRTERITRESSILHELETYNALIPRERELSATLFIEIEDRNAREQFLVAARGFERHVAIVVDGERQPAVWEPSRELDDRASAVLYLRFPLTEAAAKAFRDAAKGARDVAGLALVVTHPVYEATTPLPLVAVKSLAEDLDG